MNNIQLFIEGQELELTEAVKFAITKQFDDLTNPTTIINDWSKTVEIPFSLKNNQIFGHIYDPHRVILAGDTSLTTGIYFDPTKKLDFKLVYNAQTIMTGYAKMLTVKQNNGNGVYEIVLSGQLGKLFQEMNKITLDNSQSDSQYYINGRDYFEAQMSAQLIKECWDDPEGNSTTNPSKYIGFAPCEVTQEDDIDYTVYQNNSNEIQKLSDVLETRDFTNKTGIPAEKVIEKGMSPRGIGEFRSYKQIPYIHFNRLFEIFSDKVQQITGYTVHLDDDFKNADEQTNFGKLKFILKRFDAKNVVDYDNRYKTGSVEQNFVYHSASYSRDGYEPTLQNNTTVLTVPSTVTTEQYPLMDGELFKVEKPTMIKISGLQTSIAVTLNRNLDSETTVRLNPDVCFIVTYAIARADGSIINNNFRRVCVVGQNQNNIDTSGYDAVCVFNDNIIQTKNTVISTIVTCPDFGPVVIDEDFKIVCTISSFDTLTTYDHISLFQYQTSSSWGAIGIGNLTFKTYGAGFEIKVTPDFFRTGYKFSLNELWDNEHNLFTEIINYTKMYALVWQVDDINKKINLVPRSKYFSDYKIVDWTDKLDKSKDFLIKPVYFDSKYVKLNYKDSKLGLNEQYKEEFGYNYGEKLLVTDYNFDTNTNELFKNIPFTFDYSPNVLLWTTLYEEQKVVYSMNNENFVYCQDKDGKYVDLFGCLMLYAGTKSFDKTFSPRKILITDDTQQMERVHTYCYSQGNGNDNHIEVLSYPVLSNIIVKEDAGVLINPKKYVYCNLFEIPKKLYTLDNPFSKKSKLVPVNQSLYSRFFKKYFDERYSIQTKVVTCYMNLTNLDYINFKFNQFVMIDNQLYMVNKISDYDMCSDETTKVELITVNDINNYI